MSFIKNLPYKVLKQQVVVLGSIPTGGGPPVGIFVDESDLGRPGLK